MHYIQLIQITELLSYCTYTHYTCAVLASASTFIISLWSDRKTVGEKTIPRLLESIWFTALESETSFKKLNGEMENYSTSSYVHFGLFLDIFCRILVACTNICMYVCMYVCLYQYQVHLCMMHVCMYYVPDKIFQCR